VQKLPLLAEGCNDPASVRVLSDVAASATGHQDFDAWLAIFFQQQGTAAAFRGACRGQ
jgi:hypothetical protein